MELGGVKDQHMHSMLCDHGKWFGWKCSNGLKDPLKGFLGLVIFEFEFLAGSDFLIVLVGESCPNMVIGGKGRCFSLKIMVWHFTSFELKKNDKKFLQETGGTLAKHRWNPVLGSVWSVGPFLGCPEISLAEPIWGCRQIRQVWKTRQSTILTRETIFKFFENS